MLSGIFNLLKSFANLIVSLGQLILDAITGVINIITMIPTYVNYVADVIDILPAWLSVFALGILTITVVWAIRRAI